MHPIFIDNVDLSDVIEESVYELPVTTNSIPIGTVAILITGTGTLSGDCEIKLDPTDTPKNGWSYVINWRATLSQPTPPATQYKMYIQGEDYTALLIGEANQDFHVEYLNGAWEVSNLPSTITTRLTPYALISNIAGYIATALAAFTGSTTITTLGTIVTGLWHGTPIADAYIASAASWNAKAPLASPALTGTPTSTTAAYGTNTTQIATNQFVQSAIAPYSLYYTDPNPWAAGTYDLAGIAVGIYNTIDLTSITGNVILEALGAPSTSISEITINMPVAGGAYTVTAGSLVAFTTKTGVDTHTMVLVLAWSLVAGKYIQKAFSQN